MKKFGWFVVIVGVIAFIFGIVAAVKAAKNVRKEDEETSSLGV